jgi:uncharacterized protein YkwD
VRGHCQPNVHWVGAEEGRGVAATDPCPMRRRSRIVKYVVVLLAGTSLLASAGTASAAGCKNQLMAPTKSNIKTYERAVRCLLNRERTKRGMKSLASHWALRKAAERHSRSMVRHHYFDHFGADGSSPKSRMKKAGYGGSSFGENITYGTGGYATPRNVMQRWMASSGHRANILNGGYDDLGVGIAIGTPQGSTGVTVTTTFGGR